MNKYKIIGITLLSIPLILAFAFMVITFGFWKGLLVFITSAIFSVTLIGLMAFGVYFLSKEVVVDPIVLPFKPAIIEDPALTEPPTATDIPAPVVETTTIETK